MKKVNSFAIFVVMLFFVSSGFAQLMYEEETVSNGIAGNFGFKMNSKVYLTATAKQEVSDMQFTGSMMKHFNSKDPSIKITRLDKEVFWTLDTNKKQYTEMDFASLKDIFKEGMSDESMPMMEDQEEEEEIDESEYEWEKPVVSVEKRDKNQTVNGFKCNNYFVKVLIIGTHKETGIKDTMKITNDTWNTVIVPKAMAEIKAFNEALVKKLGMEAPMQGMGQMLAAYKSYLKEMSTEVDKIDGYPIKSTVAMTSTNHVREAQNESADEDEDSNVEISKKGFGNMLGGFAKKMAKNAAKKKEKSSAKEVFQYTHQLKSLKRVDIPASKFNVPADYKKVEALPTEMPF